MAKLRLRDWLFLSGVGAAAAVVSVSLYHYTRLPLWACFGVGWAVGMGIFALYDYICSRRYKDYCVWDEFCALCRGTEDILCSSSLAKSEDSRCEWCSHYVPVDGGCGCCTLLPDPITVPWCRVPCSFYELVQEKEVSK